jgi:acyl-CoA dehydrogenase
VVAKTDPTAGARGISLIMVETQGLAGYRRGKILEKIGLKGQDTCELFFDDVEVPLGNLFWPEPGRGFLQLMEQLPGPRTMVEESALFHQKGTPPRLRRPVIKKVVILVGTAEVTHCVYVPH